MKLLILDWGAYTQPDLNASFVKNNIQYKILNYCFGSKSEDSFFSFRFNRYLKADSYDAVFTVNYFPLIAECCFQNQVPYLSWSYDNPLNVPEIEQTLSYPTNSVFLFDRIQVEGFRKAGFQNVYHLPLAVNPDRLLSIPLTAEDAQNYSADLSFVGKLYTSTFPELISPLSDYDKGYLNSLVESQLLIYGYYFLDELITEDLLLRLNRQYAKSLGSASFTLSKEQLSYSMATYVTHKERLMLLALLSSEFHLHFYSRETHPLLKNVSFRGSAGYYTDMPKAFKFSRINLNMTLKILQSGIPLRALDILGCGGLLFSNYQPELAEYFIPGTDFVQYDSIPDAMEKAAYYLKHEPLRQKIAANGCEKASSRFSYSVQLEKLFCTAGLLL